MTTMPTPTTPNTVGQPQPWKWIAGLLAAALAITIVAAAVESYYLYRAAHPAPARPVLTLAPLEDDPILRDPATTTGDVWNQLSQLHQQMDQMFNQTLNQFPIDNGAVLPAVSSPSLDVREEKDHYTVRVDMPGADKGTVKVNVEGRLLTVSGERSAVNETKDNDRVIRSERSMAQFVRAIELPGPVKADAVNATYDNGVLTLELPKADRAGSGTQVPVH